MSISNRAVTDTQLSILAIVLKLYPQESDKGGLGPSYQLALSKCSDFYKAI